MKKSAFYGLRDFSATLRLARTPAVLALLALLSGCNGLFGFQTKFSGKTQNDSGPTIITTTLSGTSSTGGGNANSGGNTGSANNGNSGSSANNGNSDGATGGVAGNSNSNGGATGNSNGSATGNSNGTHANGGGSGPSVAFKTQGTDKIYYGQWFPVQVNLTGFPGTTATYSAQVSAPASDPNAATPVAMISLSPNPSSTAEISTVLSGSIGVRNGTGSLTVYVAGYQTQGSLELTLGVTVNSYDNSYTSQLSPLILTILERAGFIQDGIRFTASTNMADPSTGKGWNMVVSNDPAGTSTPQAKITNQDASDALLTIAESSSGYTVISPSSVVGNTLPNAQVVVGKVALNTTTSSPKSQVVALAASASSSIVGVNQASEGFFMFFTGGTLIIDQVGYYTLCASSAVNLVFENQMIPSLPNSFISIYAGTSDVNFTMNPANSFIPVPNLFVSGSGGLYLSGVINVNGNITIGGLAPGHPPPAARLLKAVAPARCRHQRFWTVGIVFTPMPPPKRWFSKSYRTSGNPPDARVHSLAVSISRYQPSLAERTRLVPL